ncbi:MAG: hypothetical protein AAGL90_07845 [Pseudomonadota bacterium]
MKQQIGLGLIILIAAACVDPAADGSNAGQAAVTATPIATPQDTAEKKIRLGAPFQTVKPGASVSFRHDPPVAVNAGENGAVTLHVSEGYPHGTMTLKAIGDRGLEVFGSTVTQRVDMAGATTHAWQVNYSADADGVYYLGVVATVDLGDELSQSRAHTVRLQIGDWQPAQAKAEAERSVERLSDGAPAIIMNAEETIERR